MNVWVALKKNGEVVFAHCTCMAGLGETCSHVAATCFYLEAAVKMESNVACTSKSCSWSKPKSKMAEFSEVQGIEFSNPNKRRRQVFDGACTKPHVQKIIYVTPPPNHSDFKSFYNGLHKISAKSVVLSVTSPFTTNFVPTSIKHNLPATFSSLYKNEFHDMAYEMLVTKGDEFLSNLQYSQSQVTVAC